MQAPVGPVTSARRIMLGSMKPSEGPTTTDSVRPTIKLFSFHSLNTRHSRSRPWVAGTFLLSSSPSLLLLLAAVIFSAFASSSSTFVHAAATTMASDVQKEEEETASAWSAGSSWSSVTAGISSTTQLVSDGSVTQVGGRHLVENCPTFLLADHADLAASDGWNLLSVSCYLGAEISVNGAVRRMKIKKHPSAVGVVEVDRQATSENEGRHFNISSGAALEVDGLTLTGGYADVRLFSFKFLSSRPIYVHVGAAAFPTLMLYLSSFVCSSILSFLFFLFFFCSQEGGVIFVQDSGSSAIFNSCILTKNSATDYGGVAVVQSSGSAIFTTCTLTENSATFSGGVVHVQSSGSAIFTSCILTENTGKHGGVAYVINSGSTAFNSCNLTKNSATLEGGVAVVQESGSSATFTTCTLTENTASQYGGVAIVQSSGSAAFTSCTLTINSATITGGVAFVQSSGSAIFTSCNLTKNSAPGGDGGVAFVQTSGSAAFNSCVLTENTASNGGVAGVRNSGSVGSSAIFTDCSLTKNSATDVSCDSVW